VTEDLKDLAVELKRRGMDPGYFRAQRRRGLSTEEILAPWPPRPLSNRVGTRRFRRRVVVGTYAGWLLIVAITRLVTLPIPGWVTPGFLVFLGLALLNSLIGVFWLNRRTYINTPALGDVELDERLIQIRNQAYRRAFQVFAPVALIGYPLTWAALQLQPNVQGQINAFIIFSGVTLLATTLPTAIVAWREPDPAEPEPLQT
jgi:hypothetical protein